MFANVFIKISNNINLFQLKKILEKETYIFSGIEYLFNIFTLEKLMRIPLGIHILITFNLF
jgi:hypothetical protein